MSSQTTAYIKREETIDCSTQINWRNKMLKWSDELQHGWVDRAESKGETGMIGNYTAELWRHMSCCLWPYWMSHSRGTQSPFRAWINGSWLDSGGLLCCFCLLWHRPSLCEVSMLLPDKGTTSSKGGRERDGETETGGGGSLRGGIKAVFCSFLPHCVLLSRCVQVQM